MFVNRKKLPKNKIKLKLKKKKEKECSYRPLSRPTPHTRIV